jgi:hypothetical protein
MCSDWLGDNHDSTCNLVKISEWEMRGIWKRAVCRCDVSTLGRGGDEAAAGRSAVASLAVFWPLGPCNRFTSPELDVSIRHPVQKSNMSWPVTPAGVLWIRQCRGIGSGSCILFCNHTQSTMCLEPGGAPHLVALWRRGVELYVSW